MKMAKQLGQKFLGGFVIGLRLFLFIHRRVPVLMTGPRQTRKSLPGGCVRDQRLCSYGPFHMSLGGSDTAQSFAKRIAQAAARQGLFCMTGW